MITRFEARNVAANQPLIGLLQEFADQKRATPAQISLAWMLANEPFIVPIPGARKSARIEKNPGAADFELTRSELEGLETELAKIEIHRSRADGEVAKLYR